MQSGTSFAISPPRLSLGVAKNALTSGRTGTVKSLWCEPFRRSPSRPFNASSSRACLLYSLIYTLSTLPILSVLFSSHFPPLLRAAPLPYPLPSPHPPHPFDSRSKENHSRSKEISERFVRKQPFKTVTCALQTARQSLRNPPQK